MEIPDVSVKLTNRDMDVLAVLWDSDRPLTASEVVEVNPALNKNTVQPVLRKLLKNKLIKVADIVYSGTVLSRSYVSAMSRDEFALHHLSSDFKKIEKNLSKASFLSFLLKAEDDPKRLDEDIKELEELLDSYKNKEE